MNKSIAEEKHRRPVVGVMGSGTEAYEDLSIPLGRELAALNVHLLTGGGGGCMSAVAGGFQSVRDRRGLVIGVLPAINEATPHLSWTGYPNPYVEIVIRTHLPRSGVDGTLPASRNHINILSSDVVVVLPGGSGTLSEIELARRYEKPVIAYVSDGFDGFADDILRTDSLADTIDFVRLNIRDVEAD